MNSDNHISQQLPIDPVLNRLAVSDSWINELQGYNRTQVTVTNLTNTNQEVRLWGANKGAHLNNVLTAISTGLYPQAIAYNPVNGLVYVANQLDNTVEVFDEYGSREAVIQLEPAFPGFTSPVAMTVNTNNGQVYIAGAISNSVYVISVAFQLTATIPVAVRPVALAYNAFNGLLYVSHLIGKQVSVIDPVTETLVTSVATGTDPIALEVDAQTGRWFVVNSGDDSVTIYNASNFLVDTIIPVGQRPIAAAYHSGNQKLYVLGAESKELLELDPASLSITATTPLLGEPRTIQISPTTGQIIIGEKEGHTLTILASDLSPISIIQAEQVNIGMAFDPINEVIYLTDPIAGEVAVLRLGQGAGKTVEFSEDYAEAVVDFQFNPALLKHVRAFFSDGAYSPLMSVGRSTPSGKQQSWALAFGKHQHPQQRLPIAELMEMENEVIDGQTFWDLQLLPWQRVDLMLYYTQYSRQDEL